MKKVLRFFVSRWVLTFLAAAVLAALVWFFGPVLGIGDHRPLEPFWTRIGIIAVIFLVWLLSNLRRWQKARAQDKKLVEAIAAAPTDPAATASAEEVALLSERLREALDSLRRTRIGGRFGRRFLYQLPWYMFIGPPGAGKTTALANSGLNFPLDDKTGKASAAVKGVGGTRNCDWWFADEAVLIDTAGRYTTQDSQSEVDSAAWLGFLDLLKRYRRRQPINGVLLSISLTDLAMLGETERAAHARAMRLRVRELHERLGVRLPIYVLFTKADLMAGFVEFFDNLGKEERDQVWGMTFPLDLGREEGGAVARFTAEFDLLQQRLIDRLTERLHQEPDIQRRSLIFSFPQQFAAVRDVAAEFLTEIFRPSRLEARPLLRGVYFISGTQTGTPIDRLIGAMSSQFGLQRVAVSPFSGQGRSYFLGRLLREVVFGEANVVTLDPKLERRARWTYIGAYGTAVLVLLVLSGLWVTSFFENQAMIAQMRRDAATYQSQFEVLAKNPNDFALPPVLPALATLRNMPGGYVARKQPVDLWATFGLYQGEKIGTQAVTAYRHALNTILLPRLLARVEGQMRGNLGDTDFLYEALKVYLILGRRGPLDAGLIKLWTDTDFQGSFTGDANAGVREQLSQHVAALIEQPVQEVPLDGPLIEQVRKILTAQPAAQRSYQRIVRSDTAHALPLWRIGDHGGAAATEVLYLRSGRPLSTGVDGLYTWAGYHDTFLNLVPEITQDVAEDSWVLGSQDRIGNDPMKLGLLRRDVIGLYLDDYVRRWDAVLADIAIKPFKDLNQGLDELNTLSGPNSPFRLLLTGIDQETNLTRESEGTQAAEKVAPGATRLARNEVLKQLSPSQRRLADILGPALGAGGKNDQPADPAQRVTDHFAPFHTFVGVAGKPGPMESVIAKFGQIYQSFNQAAGGANAGAAMLGVVSGAGGGAGITAQLQDASKGLPGPVAAMVGAVSQSTSSVTSAGAKQHINDVWTSSVLPLCQTAFSNRYPFFANSPVDVPLDDFTKLLAPKGMIDGFFADNLKPLVDTSNLPWKWGANNAALGLSNDALMQFQRAAEMRDGLFAGGAATMTIKFELTPLSLDAGMAQVSLDLDGQRVVYKHGPQEPAKVQWPGPNGRSQIRLTFTPTGGGAEMVTELTGPWALFRLLDKAKVVSAGRPDQFDVTFTAGGQTATFQLTASSVVNPFTMTAIRQFRCPPNL